MKRAALAEDGVSLRKGRKGRPAPPREPVSTYTKGCIKVEVAPGVIGKTDKLGLPCDTVLPWRRIPMAGHLREAVEPSWKNGSSAPTWATRQIITQIPVAAGLVPAERISPRHRYNGSALSVDVKQALSQLVAPEIRQVLSEVQTLKVEIKRLDEKIELVRNGLKAEIAALRKEIDVPCAWR